jgi:RNA-directed DNA polymerase
MRRFVLGWKKLGHEKRFGAHIVNYADDMVICCRGRAEEALVSMRDMMSKLKLTVNETKTRVCKLPEEKFDFLGYTFGRCYSPKTGRAYMGTVPSKKRVQRICAAISHETGRNKTLLDVEDISGKAQPNVTRMGQLLSRSSQQSLPCGGRQWLCAKHQVAWPGTKRFPTASFSKVHGLVSLTERTASLPWANS